MRLCLLMLFVFHSHPAWALDKVVLQLKWTHQFQFAGYYAAVEKGFYKEEGLEVELREAKPGQDSQAEVLHGAAQFGISNSSLILQRARGKPVVLLASIFQHSPDVLVVKKDNGIIRMEQLLGKKVMLGQHNEEILAYFKKLNIPLDSIERVAHSFRKQELDEDKVDAMSAYSTDFQAQLDKRGDPYIMYSPRSVGIDFYGDNLFTTEQNIRLNPKQVKAFRAASLRGWRYAMQHVDEIADLIYQKYPQRKSRENLIFEAQQMVPLLQTHLIEMGYINPVRWKNIATIYAELGMLRSDFPLDGFIYEEGKAHLPNWYYAAFSAGFLLLLFSASLAYRYAHLVRRLQQERRARKQYQEKLSRFVERTTLAIYGAGDGVWDFDNTTGSVVYSKTYKNMLGFEEHEFDNLTDVWKERVHPSDKEEMADGVRRYFAAKPDAQGREPMIASEYRMQCKDGSWKWVMSRGNVVARDMHGKPIRMTGTLTDITQRKEAEQEQMQRLLEAAPEAMLLINLDGAICFVNQAAETMFSYRRAQLLGQSIEMLVPQDKRDAHVGLRQGFQKLGEINRKRMSNREVSALRRDGIELPVEVSLSIFPISGQRMVVATIRDISERQIADANLKSSEQRYRQIVETAAEGIWMIDLNGKTSFVNPRMVIMLGFAAEEILGRAMTEFMDEEGISIARTFLAQVEAGSSERSDLKFIRKDGSVLWVSMAATAVRDSINNMTGAMAMLIDVSDRRLAVDALSATHERLNSIFNTVTNGVILQNREGDILESNIAAQNMLSLAESTPRDWLLYAEDEERLPIEKFPAEQVFATGKAVRDVVLGMRYANGQLRWFSVNAEPVSFASRQMVKVVSSFTDITEHKRAADLLRQSEERLQEILEAIPVTIYIKDAQGIFILANHASEQQFGVKFSELKGSTGRQFFSAASMAMHEGQDQAAWQSRILLEQEEILWHMAKGEYRHIRTYRKPIFDEKALPAYLICVCVDVSEHKRAESALRELNESLEERVARRTRQLDKAKQIAEEANKSKGVFLANMSHEIRTPMNGVIGMAYLALQTNLSAQQRDYLEKIRFAGEHLLGIIDNILDFSKIDAGKLELDQAPFALPNVLQNMTSFLAERLLEKKLTLILDRADDVPTQLFGDQLRLRQVLVNLLGNAVKFSQDGEIVVKIRLLLSQPEHVILRFEFVDCGIGISEEGLQKLFHSFQQADTSTTREFGGTGLGLAISKQLVQLMGGEIGVESKLGQGSQFWFTANFALPSQAELDAVQQQMTSGAQGNLQGKRILLAEDNPFNQQIASELLQQAGAVVQLANNGVEALALLAKNEFDCVLMDVQMPLMDGLQATKQIRAMPEHAKLIVIAMTANATIEDRDRCLQHGMNDFVSKPIDPHRLYQTIIKCMATHGQAGGDAPALPPSLNPEESTAHEEHPESSLKLPSNAQIINLHALVKLIGNKPEKIRKFTQEFLCSCQLGMSEMQAALAMADVKQCADLAHRMKSAAKTVGAMGFANLCEELEHLDDTCELQQVQKSVADLAQMLAAIQQEIADYPDLQAAQR